MHACRSTLEDPTEPPDGVRLTREHAPYLWAVVDDLAAKVGTRTPDEIQLIPEVNAAVTEEAKWLGMVGGRRYLLIGTPLLQTFTVDQLRAVLAHELGHYSSNHTRLGALSYRGRLMIVNTVQRMDGLISWLMLGYAKLYILVESAVSRRQELEADDASVRLAGREAMISALAELPVLAKTWGFYLKNYVGYGLDSGYAPAGIIGNFPAMVAARQGELNEMRANPAPEEHSRWDSHPPIAARIAVIARKPDVAVTRDGRPALVLLPNADAFFGLLEQKFQFGQRQRVSFAEYTSHAQQANGQYAADHLYRAAGRIMGDPQPGLRTVLALIQSGQFDKLEPDLKLVVETAIAVAAVQSGAAAWRMSWSGPAQLTGRDGSEFPLARYAEPFILGDPAGAGQAVESLAALGINLGVAHAVNTTATADRADVVGAMVNILVDGDRRDLLVLDTGLVVVPGSARLKMGGAKQRLAQLAQIPPADLIRMAGHRYLPYEEMRQVVKTGTVRKTYEISMHGGALVKIKRGTETEDLAENAALDRAMAGVMGSRTVD